MIWLDPYHQEMVNAGLRDVVARAIWRRACLLSLDPAGTFRYAYTMAYVQDIGIRPPGWYIEALVSELTRMT